jgi:hypothetical protein
VKGHQDDDADAVLNEWAQQNIEMDLMAKAYRTKMYVELQGISPQHPVDYSPWMVSVNGELLTKKVSKHLYDHCAKDMILDYWAQKDCLQESTPHEVDWKALDKALSACNSGIRREMIKHSTGYFAHGQNQLQRKFWKHSKCPRCDAEVEDADHIVKCPTPEATNIWEGGITGLRIKLRDIKTKSCIEEILRERLNAWRNKTPYKTYLHLPRLVALALEEQDKSGWDNALYGRWVKGWALAQDEDFKRRKIDRTGRRWLAAIIAQLFKTSWDMWEHRNGILHNMEKGAESKQINADILQEFQQGFAGLPASIQTWTNKPQEEVLQSKLAARRAWLRKIRAARTLREIQYAADQGLHELQRERNLMAQFLHLQPENIGQVGIARHQQQEQQRERNQQRRQAQRQRAEVQIRTTTQLQQSMARWIRQPRS